jgi:fatty acid desaturase
VRALPAADPDERDHARVPRDPRGPEYGEPSRAERVATTLLVLVLVLGVATAVLAAVTDLGGLLSGLGPPWLTLPIAVIILILLMVLISVG